MTEDELKAYLRRQGINITNTEYEYTGPSNEWTEAEQKNDCCETVPDAHECVEDGLIEPWNSAGDGGPVVFEDHTQIVSDLLRDNVLYREQGLTVKVIYEGPDPCGTKETRWRGTLPCCDDPTIPDLNPVSGHSTIKPDGTPYSFIVQGGQTPIIWSVEGAGLSVSGDKWTGVVRANDCFCKGKVIATDSCDQVVFWDVSSEDGIWNAITEEEWGGPSFPLEYQYASDTPDDYQGKLWWEGDGYRVYSVWQSTGSGGYSNTGSALPWADNMRVVPPEGVSSAVLFFGFSESAWLDGYAWTAWDGSSPAQGFVGIPATQDHVRYAWYVGTSYYYKWECPGIEELLYDDDNSADTIADNSSGVVRWDGGTGPFEVRISGTGFYLDADLSAQQRSTSDSYIRVYTGDACGTGTITITDICEQTANGNVYSTNGEWQGTCITFGWNSAQAGGSCFSYHNCWQYEMDFNYCGVSNNQTLVNCQDEGGSYAYSHFYNSRNVWQVSGKYWAQGAALTPEHSNCKPSYDALTQTLTDMGIPAGTDVGLYEPLIADIVGNGLCSPPDDPCVFSCIGD